MTSPVCLESSKFSCGGCTTGHKGMNDHMYRKLKLRGALSYPPMWPRRPNSTEHNYTLQGCPLHQEASLEAWPTDILLTSRLCGCGQVLEKMVTFITVSELIVSTLTDPSTLPEGESWCGRKHTLVSYYYCLYDVCGRTNYLPSLSFTGQTTRNIWTPKRYIIPTNNLTHRPSPQKLEKFDNKIQSRDHPKTYTLAEFEEKKNPDEFTTIYTWTRKHPS